MEMIRNYSRKLFILEKKWIYLRETLKIKMPQAEATTCYKEMSILRTLTKVQSKYYVPYRTETFTNIQEYTKII